MKNTNHGEVAELLYRFWLAFYSTRKEDPYYFINVDKLLEDAFLWINVIYLLFIVK